MDDVEGGEGEAYGRRSGVNRPESRWQAAGLRHKPSTASSLSGDFRDEKAGRELATDGRGTRGIWNEPKGPSS